MDQKILTLLNKIEEGSWPNSWELAKALNADHKEVVGGLKSLEAKGYLALAQKKEGKFSLNKEGEDYAQNGTPEFAIYKYLITQEGQTAERPAVQAMMGKSYGIGFGKGKGRYFKMENNKLVVLDKIKPDEVKDDHAEVLRLMQGHDFFDGKFDEISKQPVIKDMKKRKLFDTKQLVYYELAKGDNFAAELKVLMADLTIESLNNGSWKDASNFKALNLNAKGKEIQIGGLHPLLKLRSEFRTILLEMGFEEMKTNNFVESSFWNFDTLFQPQQHPAREAHDTFFLSKPELCQYKSDEMNTYVDRVQQMHEKGYKDENGESYGWKYNWSKHESTKNILRTHTTAVSSRYLKQLADELKQTGKFVPKKLFSIDRVFRNETLDATHLAEFHQVEGLIIGKNLGLAQLKCFIRDFFAKIGITQLKFKPAYNPYTEPSMEIFVYHPLLKKTIEIGNSGVFRPEMLKPMGFPDDVTVIAWGLSLERPAMINFQCDNIRELVGHKVDFKFVKNSQIIG